MYDSISENFTTTNYQSLFNNSTREVRLHLPISESLKIAIPFNVLFPTLRVKSNELLIATFAFFFV